MGIDRRIMRFIPVILLIVEISYSKIITATRTERPPTIDGKLEDPCWRKVIPCIDFIQSYPEENTAPSESTEVKVVYDDKALYIAVSAYDSQPSEIVARLSRRDKWCESDWITIMIDSYYDHRTGFRFSTNPKGVKIDAYIYNDGWEDWDWDSVWEVKTDINGKGWVAEFKIPYSALRFPKKEEYVWGFEISRYIGRKKETIQWVLIPRASSGLISHFGELKGIRGISPSRYTEFLPYGVTKLDIEETKREPFGGIGLDMKHSISTNLILDGALNPDFGQVEADPAVLNLSEFEYYYPEKRPFFIEGKNFFDTHFQLFYSRRIGKPPDYCNPEDVIEEPDFTTILGALKLTGKSKRGTSLGILDALTSPEYGLTESKKKRLIEPLTNYSIVRLEQDILGGSSDIGIMATGVHRYNANPAYSGGVDWGLKFFENNYQFEGQVAGSSKNKEKGWAGFLEAGKVGGRWVEMGIEGEAISPEFEINDCGYLWRNDHQNMNLWFTFHTLDTLWITRNTYQNINFHMSKNFSDITLSRSINYSLDIGFKNYWYLWMGGGYNLGGYSDRETRGGPIVKVLPSYYLWIGLFTDSRKILYLSPNLNFFRSRTGGESHRISLSITFKPVASLKLSLSTGYSWWYDDAQWVDNIDTHCIFGELYGNQINTALRADFTLSPKLSFQLYSQPFVAVGRYRRFKELIEPGSYKFEPYVLDYNPDFNTKSLRVSVVLRWEYRSGSTIYLVWQHKGYNGLHPGDFSPFRDLKDAILSKGIDIFLFKINYWWSI